MSTDDIVHPLGSLSSHRDGSGPANKFRITESAFSMALILRFHGSSAQSTSLFIVSLAMCFSGTKGNLFLRIFGSISQSCPCSSSPTTNAFTMFRIWRLLFSKHFMSFSPSSTDMYGQLDTTLTSITPTSNASIDAVQVSSQWFHSVPPVLQVE